VLLNRGRKAAETVAGAGVVQRFRLRLPASVPAKAREFLEAGTFDRSSNIPTVSDKKNRNIGFKYIETVKLGIGQPTFNGYRTK
jgi:hypothetical protein